MLWQDFLIDRPLDDRTLTTVLAMLLPVDSSQIGIVHDAVELPKIKNRDAHLLCETSPVKGDFMLGLQLYVLNEQLEHWLGEQDDCVLIGRFCEIAHCSALVDDGSANPYSWLLIRATGTIQPVLLDSERLDQDEYVVIADIPADAMASD